MASSKERARWEKWYDQTTARMDRQAKSIQRLVLLLTESTAALHEIAAMGDGHLTTAQLPLSPAIARAQEALDRIEKPAAAVGQSTEESDQEDLIDPRRNQK